MTFKTMTELNAAEPHLRDLEITVDGLNVVDIQFAGPGVWVPRFTVQISGDQGIDATTGQRRVYLAAAEYLRSALLNNGTGDGAKPHAFVPHANVSREDEPGDQDVAVSIAESAIAGLLKAYSEPVIDPEGNGPIENFEWFGKSLHIVVLTVDFDLTEKRILSAEAFDKLQAAIDAPADPSPELVKLMSNQLTPRGRADEINTQLLAQLRPFSFNLALTQTGETKEFDGAPHVSLIHKVSDGAAAVVYWVPADKSDQFKTLEHVINGVLLLPVSNGVNRIEYLVSSPQGGTADQLDVRNTTIVENGGNPLDADACQPDVRNTTKLFDGIQHKALVVPVAADTIDMVTIWVREDFTGEIDSLDDVRDDARLTCESPAGAEPTEWRLL